MVGAGKSHHHVSLDLLVGVNFVGPDGTVHDFGRYDTDFVLRERSTLSEFLAKGILQERVHA